MWFDYMVRDDTNHDDTNHDENHNHEPWRQNIRS
jgi:hypothetical protein